MLSGTRVVASIRLFRIGSRLLARPCSFRAVCLMVVHPHQVIYQVIKLLAVLHIPTQRALVVVELLLHIYKVNTK